MMKEQVAPLPGPDGIRLRFPFVTLLIGALLVAGTYAQFVLGGATFRPDGSFTGTPTNWVLGAKVPSLIAHGEWWRFLSAAFLHGSFMHLATNLVGLLILGLLTESLYRPVRYVALFVLSTISGTCFSYVISPDISLGASTGVMGLLGALLVHNFRYRTWLPPAWRNAFGVLIGMVFVQLGFDLAWQQVDIAGHIGGLIGGIVVGCAFRSQALPRAPMYREWIPAPAAGLVTLALAAYTGWGMWASCENNPELLRAGRMRSNFPRIREIALALERRPYMVEARLYRAQLLFVRGEGERGLEEYRLALKQQPNLLSGRGSSRLRLQILDFHLSRGMQKYDGADWDDALESTRYVMEHGVTDAQRAQAHNQYAWVLADKMRVRLDEAEQHSRESLRLRPNEPAYLDTLAWISYHRSKHSEAYRQQLEAIQQAENRGMAGSESMSELYLHLGAIQEKLNRLTEARASYARALRTRPGYLDAVTSLRRLSGIQEPPDPLSPSPGQDPAVVRGIL